MSALTALFVAALASHDAVARRDALLDPAVSRAWLWIDVDRDGRVDTLTHDDLGRLVLLMQTDTGGFEDRTAEAGLEGLAWRSAASVDVDGDERADLALLDEAGALRLLLQADPGRFLPIDVEGVARAEGWVSVRVADVDGDRRADLHLDGGAEQALLVSRGDGTFRVTRLALADVASRDAGASSARAMAGGAAAATPGAPGATPVGAAGPAGQALGAALVCSGSVQDVATAACLEASSAPTLGRLYPLTTNLFVAANGSVGVGTTSPGARLDVAGVARATQLVSTVGTGTAPLTVNSRTVVSLLNADLLDGLDATAFRAASVLIGTTDLALGAVTTDRLADGAVTASKLGAGAVGASALAPAAVGASALAVGAVTAPALAANAVGGAALANGAVSAPKLAAAAVGSAALADGAVTAAKLAGGAVGTSALANGAVTGAKVADQTLTTDNFADGSVTAPKLAAGAVTLGALGAGSVSSLAIVDGGVTAADLAASSVSNAKLQDGAVSTLKIQDGSVFSVDLAPGAVDASALAPGAVGAIALAADAVTSSTVRDDSLTQDDLGDSSVGVAELQVGAVVDSRIAAGAVTNAKLAAGSVSADKLAAAAVTPAALAPGAVTGGALAPGAVTGAALAAGAVDSSKILDGGIGAIDLAPGSVTSAAILNGTITSADLADGSINAASLAPGAVDSSAVADGALRDVDISPNAAIAGTKVRPDFGGQLVTSPTGALFGNPAADRVQLGTAGAPLRAFGAALAAELNGRVLATSATAAERTLDVLHTGGGTAARVLSQDPQNTSTQPALHVVAGGDGQARGVLVENTGLANTGSAFQVVHHGAGPGLDVTSGALPLRIDRSINSGSLLEARNTADIEFRVDSSGDVLCDGAFLGGGADYAEWLERADAAEVIEPGDVVGVRAGRIGKALAGAERFMVASTNPAVVGNHPDAETDTREGATVVAFVGRAPVKVVGGCAPGDLLVPSGRGDGTAVALAPDAVTAADLARVVGTAWASASGEGVALVDTLVGVGVERAAALAVARIEAELAQRDALIARLAARLEALERR